MNRAEALLQILTLRCQEASEISSKTLDGIPTRSEYVAWWIHLRLCKGCRLFHDDILRLRVVAQKLPDTSATTRSQLTPEDREKLATALRHMQ